MILPIPRPDKITVKIPKPPIGQPDNTTGICFRVGNNYCCYENSSARYSNTVCHELAIPENPDRPDDELSFEDYLLIFIDESIYPSAKNVYGYVYQNGDPNSYWYEDMDQFRPLYQSQSIDINKILIFHVGTPPTCAAVPIYPSRNVRSGYEMPIPNNRIILTPRNRPRCFSATGQDFNLTGLWIDDKIKSIFGQIPQDKKLNIFVDDSPSLTWEGVSIGITEYQSVAASQNLRTRTILCNTERWLRWVVNTFNKNPICS